MNYWGGGNPQVHLIHSNFNGYHHINNQIDKMHYRNTIIPTKHNINISILYNYKLIAITNVSVTTLKHA